MSHKHTLLLVDDEQDILLALSALLERADRLIVLASNADAALTELARREIALVISAQGMPGLKGIELLARIRQQAPHCVRMLMTGRSDIGEAVAAINEGGIARYITKPWRDKEVQFAVSEALARYDLAEHNRDLTRQLAEQNRRLENFNAALELEVVGRMRTLSLKLKELQGKDRIAQHMLMLHSLEETLDLVLQVIGEIIQLDKAVIYLIGDTGPAVVAALGTAKRGQIATRQELQQLAITAIHHSAFKAVADSGQPMRIEDPVGHPLPPFAIVPILRGKELLGFIEVANPHTRQPLSEDEVEVLASFALQAAMAIQEAQTHGDIDTWRGQLNEVMRDVTQLGYIDE